MSAVRLPPPTVTLTLRTTFSLLPFTPLLLLILKFHVSISLTVCCRKLIIKGGLTNFDIKYPGLYVRHVFCVAVTPLSLQRERSHGQYINKWISNCYSKSCMPEPSEKGGFCQEPVLWHILREMLIKCGHFQLNHSTSCVCTQYLTASGNISPLCSWLRTVVVYLAI